MSRADDVETRLVRGLVEALEQLPHSRVQTRSKPRQSRLPDTGQDAAVDLWVSERHAVLLVETKTSVYPRDVREFLWRLRNYAAHTQHRAAEIIPVLAARVMSPGAKEILRTENAAYYESGGSLFIAAPGLYIYIDKPAAKGIRNPARAIFSGKRTDVLQALFHRAGERVGVHELAELVEVSPTTVSQTLIELERFEWVDVRGRGPAKERGLANPRALLDTWAKHAQLTPLLHQRRYYVPNASVEVLADRLDDVCREQHASYVLTMEGAAQRYTPYLSAISCLVCRLGSGKEGDDAIAALDARAVSEGANLIVIETPTTSEFLFKERVGSAWLANPIQVYLDLLRAGGRAKDMAEHLRQQRLGF